MDVHDPDLLDLHRRLEEAGARPDYLEIFKAATRDLARIRAALPDLSLAYHAEGLWLTEPDLRSGYPWTDTLDTIAGHAAALQAAWINHECASKQFGGYAFGTYLPPLFTGAAADATAVNAALAQARLDARAGESSPLLLLELPPLTYAAFGDLPASEFFTRVVRQTSCGLVLDIGHLWTHWRYRERRQIPRLEDFVTRFLETFPLERVVQIHLAGLGSEDADSPPPLPWWIDRHEAPVPGVLLDLLRHVLSQLRLTALKGIALEVDTKPIPLIIEEFARFRAEFGDYSFRSGVPAAKEHVSKGMSDRERDSLRELYVAYARVMSGQEPLDASRLLSLSQSVDRDGLARYQTRYLPHEILCWGGDVAALFPAVWAELARRGVTGDDFVRHWFSRPRPATGTYDFFYIKLERWVEFVGALAPDLLPEAVREAETLRGLHAELNDEATVLEPQA